MKKSHLVTDAEAEKVQHVAEAVGFFTHTCGYQPGCLCTEMYPARIKRLLSTRAVLIAMVQELDDALGYHRNEITAQDKARALLAELHGEKP